MSNSCFIKMAKIIKLMTENGIKFPPVFTCPFMKSFTSMHFSNCTVSIKITVILLGMTYFIYKSIEICIQLRIGICLKRIAGSFNDLEDI